MADIRKDSVLMTFVNELAERGNKIIKSAYARSDYSKNKTQNLHDSYGSAVYYKGKLIESSIRYMDEKASVGRFNMYDGEVQKGRNEIAKFLRKYKAIENGMELVVAVAMFYARPLEEGTYAKNGRKWKVISMAEDELRKLQSEIKGSSVNTIRKGKRE